VKDPLVALRDVEFGYGRRAVLSGVSVDIHEREFLGIVGPNGAGKSTLIKGILGLLPPRRGTVAYRGGRRALRFGYVPQRETVDAIFPVTALEIVLMGRSALAGPLRWPGRSGRERAREALAHVGIADLAGKRFRDLSGGQQQRVLIARALAYEPRILLLDEPTNGMDLDSEHALMELVASLHERDGLTVLMVSHLLNVVVNYVEDLVLIDRSLFLAGPLVEMLTESNMRRLYPTGVTIGTVGGRRVVLPGARAEGGA